ncbi:hypothetical protein [Streptomyces sp. HC307]|uniref:hypothetical protein n=1 Tax=Streptomyces flavusporus TaxID=3385496 RepID=UPI0039170F39
MADSVRVTRAGALRPGSPSAPAAVALITVAVLTAPDGSPPKYARSWTVHGAEGLRVHVAPAPCGGPAA